MLSHLLGILTHPAAEWQRIHDRNYSVVACYRKFVLWLAAIPAVAGLIGTTQVGWSIGIRESIRLTFGSALLIAIAYYLAVLAAVFLVGKAIHWMAVTYGADSDLDRAVTLAAFTATPMFLAGIVQLYPILWLDFLVAIAALGHSVYLLYNGVPIMMNTSQERGFLFASAVLTVGLVAFVALLATTAMLWGMGMQPAFVS